MASATKVVHEFPFFFKVYEDGRIERFLTTPRLPPSTDPTTGVQSKDVVISSDLEIKSRIFLPKLNPEDPPKKLPLIIYVHGGGFCIGSPFNVITQGFLTPLVSQIPAVVIAVGYRLAPEHPLPTAYDDCWATFQWIDSHATGSGPDPWINEYVDTTRVFLMGESAGANLAQYLAVQAGVNKTRLGIRGLLAIHPYFSQKEPDKLIQYLYPTSSGSDDEAKLNPRSDPDLEKMGCSNVLIVVAEKDFLRPRGMDYMEALKKSKWEGKVEFMENEGEGHCFHLFNPSSEKTKALVQDLISHVNKLL
ncbi:2-hydroxyisoflavanone dehydratase-like [Cynara cardunculus var. scolymus]|uniref:Alpha/beta hydrolase fold-3 n=1 Tax=Cynara cardunculus var. scolymus TaxID=59895 RepID=A0A118K0W8_CYNCS|nr:2-hydroxyisoflavanone dehydratase-like [Cynara cardunculus var. scolymus]KVI01980.1 Alpha/beta hydrolase fold-3 [Cynara cardunculus var. scolymus]